MSTTWTTRDGKKLDVAWMDSVHLAHALNMVFRKGGINFAIIQELTDRGLYRMAHSIDKQVVIPTVRETPTVLCMLRAVLDTRPELCPAFRKSPGIFMKKCPQDHPDVWTKYTQYRLTKL